jgi:oxygen-dependent protoporphyrinogen oxidase
MPNGAVAPTHVVVLGGGISGLAAAWFVRREGMERNRPLEVTLFEATARLGGNIRTERQDGFVMDAGPDSFVATKRHAAALCAELGLASSLIGTIPENRRVYVVRRGVLHPMPEGLLLGIPAQLVPIARSRALSWRGKFRALADLAYVARRSPPADDVSIADYFGPRFGDEILDGLIEPILGGVYAGDPRKLSLRATFPQMLDIQARAGSLILGARAQLAARKAAPTASVFESLRGGMGELVDALTGALSDAKLRCGVAVTAIERAGARWIVRTSEGAATTADRVIVAVPARAAGRLLSPLDGPVGEDLDAVPYASTATVFFAFRHEQVAHPLDASGFVVPRSEGRRLVAATFVSSKWQGRAPDGYVLVRTFLGGARDESALQWDDNDLARAAEAELTSLLGVEGQPCLSRVFRHDKASPQPVVGHTARMRRVSERMKDVPGLFLIGNAYDGVGIPDCVRLAEQAARDALASA